MLQLIPTVLLAMDGDATRRSLYAAMLQYNFFFAIIVMLFCYLRTKILLRYVRRSLCPFFRIDFSTIAHFVATRFFFLLHSSICEILEEF